MRVTKRVRLFLLCLAVFYSGCFDDSYSSEGSASRPVVLARGVAHSGTVGSSKSSYYQVQLSTWSGFEIRGNTALCIIMYFCDDISKIDSDNDDDFLKVEGCGGAVRDAMSGYSTGVPGGYLYIRIDTESDSDGCKFTLTVN